MTDNVVVTAGTGTVIAADEVTDGALGTVKVQYVKIMDGTLNGTSKATIGAGGLAISNTPLTNFGAGKYETVAASVTAQVLGNTGAIGDYIEGILVIPATTSPGLVTLLDSSSTSIPVFVGGASSIATLHPFFIPLGMISLNGAWKLTTGANVSCIAIGNFT
jgi:hypothetical protein